MDEITVPILQVGSKSARPAWQVAEQGRAGGRRTARARSAQGRAALLLLVMSKSGRSNARGRALCCNALRWVWIRDGSSPEFGALKELDSAHGEVKSMRAARASGAACARHRAASQRRLRRLPRIRGLRGWST